MEKGLGIVLFNIVLWISLVTLLAINISKIAVWLENRNKRSDGFPIKG